MLGVDANIIKCSEAQMLRSSEGKKGSGWFREHVSS